VLVAVAVWLGFPASDRLLYGSAYKFVQQVPRNAYREMMAAADDAREEGNATMVGAVVVIFEVCALCVCARAAL